MKKYGHGDTANFRHQLLKKLGYVTDDGYFKYPQPQFDFFWAPATERQKTQIIVTLLGKHGQFGISEDEDEFPSDRLVTQIRLVLP